MDNTFFHLLNLSRRYSERWQHCCQAWESHVCLCRKRPCLYDTLFHLLNLSRRYSEGWQHCCQAWESHLCLCRKRPCLYDTLFHLLNLYRPFWEMFRERHDNTVIHVSHMGNYMLHARRSETLQTFTFQLLNGKQRTSVTFQTDGNIPISLHVLLFY
jgi:hypothetical protein